MQRKILTCPYCHQPLNHQAIYCMYCGKKLPKESQLLHRPSN